MFVPLDPNARRPSGRLDTPPAMAAHSILNASPSYAKFTQRMENMSNV